ncbi:MAG: hypothetical protein ACT4NY_05855 [Pseudonocardiales bacterium]
MHTAIAASAKRRSAKSWMGRLPGEREPATSDPLLLGLLAPLDLVGSLVDKDQRRAAKKRSKEIAYEGIVGTAVSDAVREIQAAVMVAVIVPVVAAGSD